MKEMDVYMVVAREFETDGSYCIYPSEIELFFSLEDANKFVENKIAELRDNPRITIKTSTSKSGRLIADTYLNNERDLSYRITKKTVK